MTLPKGTPVTLTQSAKQAYHNSGYQFVRDNVLHVDEGQIIEPTIHEDVYLAHFPLVCGRHLSLEVHVEELETFNALREAA